MKRKFLFIALLLNVSFFAVFSQVYHAGDSTALLWIANACDDNFNLNWRSEPDPGSWNYIRWSDDDTARVTGLDLFFVQLSGTLNVSALKELTWLNCTWNDLDELIISNLPKLDTLFCGRNWLTELDLSSVPNLLFLDCSQNFLLQLDVSASPNLYYLNCENSYVEDLNVSGLTNLTQLWCSMNAIDTLDLSGLWNLDYVDCSNNSLVHLGTTSLTGLEYLHCNNNNLTVLNTSDLTNLFMLKCQSNELDELNVAALSHLTSLYCGDNNLRFSTLQLAPGITELACSPQNMLFEEDTIWGNTTLNYSSEALIEGVPTQFLFYKNGYMAANNSTGSYTTTGNGIYHCTMTNTLYPSLTLYTANIIIEGATGIDIAEEPTSRLYPNPAKDRIFFSNPEGIEQVTVYSLTGDELIKVTDFFDGVDVSGLSSGTYLVRITGGNQKYLQRIVIL
jgi:hypothetical protein